LATASADGTVKLWDLRKPRNFHTIKVPEETHSISAVSFDFSGLFLAVAGTDLRLYSGKNFDLIQTWTDHQQLVTDVKFGQDMQWFASTAMDRTLRFYGLDTGAPAELMEESDV